MASLNIFRLLQLHLTQRLPSLSVCHSDNASLQPSADKCYSRDVGATCFIGHVWSLDWTWRWGSVPTPGVFVVPICALPAILSFQS
jgi:hypothetical protein